MLVLTARCTELERDHAFGVARQLLERIARPPRTPAQTAGAALYDALHGLHGRIAELADAQPLLVVVDDAHWCDPPSLRFLAYLAHRLDELSVALLVAVRSPAAGALDAVITHPDAQRLTLAPLSDAAVAQLVADRLGPEPDAAFVEACADATRGNPFFVSALLSELSAAGVAPEAASAQSVRTMVPVELVRSVLRRIAAAHPSARAVAEAASVLGRDAALHRVATLAGVDTATAAAAADALGAHDVLHPGDPLSFRHPIVAAAVAEATPALQRAGAHRAAAEVLRRHGASDEAVATHLLHALPSADEGSVAILRSAAAAATATGAPEVAAAFLERALREPPPPEEVAAVLVDLGLAEVGTRPEQAIEHLLEGSSRTRDPALRARAALGAAGALSMRGDLGHAIEVLTDARDAVEDDVVRTQLDIERLALARFEPSARHLIDDVRSHVTRPGAPRRLLAFLAQDALYANEPAEAVAELARAAWDGGALLAETTSADPVAYHAIGALLYAGHHREAEDALTAALADARARSSVLGHVHAAAAVLVLDVQRGRLRDALERGEEVLELLLALGWSLWVPLVAAQLVDALVERAQPARADELLARCGLADDLGTAPAALWALTARGRLRAAQGRLDDAVADFRESGERHAAAAARTPAMAPWRSGAALALAASGRVDEARALVHEELELAEVFGAPRPVGVALRTLGVVDRDPATLRAACDLLATADADVEHARALVDLGTALRLARCTREARSPLREGLDVAHRCGASALAQRATTELVAAGARPRRPASTGPEALTASEQRIAHMAADGMTNRQIAQLLFVSTKTVEKHLAAAFTKLGVASRRALGDALRDARPP